MSVLNTLRVPKHLYYSYAKLFNTLKTTTNIQLKVNKNQSSEYNVWPDIFRPVRKCFTSNSQYLIHND